jgi:hypothetical protein
MAVMMTVLYFWVVTPCRFIGRYQRFGETYCLHLLGSRHIYIYSQRKNKLDGNVTRNSIATSALKMETVFFSETLESTYECIRRQNLEEHHHPHRRENLKSHILN